MKDYQLYLVVATFVLIDVITMTAWQILDPFFRETKDLLPQVIKELYHLLHKCVRSFKRIFMEMQCQVVKFHFGVKPVS